MSNKQQEKEDRLIHILQKGIEYCEAHNVFDPVRAQPPLATLLGLIIEQGMHCAGHNEVEPKCF
jgi:hypothetical protein